ncbi:hypothetical protein GGI25_005484 [Coemansia spiralis]|uniref:Uncharacterized protein n=2 Tax=Coemansia TaxID=4863 RepID=A0A9W8G4G3_9FUNG|nr:hypothetical protein EDC05_005516 [Coemansia umbellata]KAJ2619509.1 hypothetical protein GGI26_005781 [Coemansia sp. RSA 1358]KAJ2671495.1 hypothetical protein GGI25_005484 [Coemansia spiralis]
MNYSYKASVHLILPLATAILLIVSALLTKTKFTQDPIYVKTHQQLGICKQQFDQIIAFGIASLSETNDHVRAKLCGGDLWIDHIAESLNADLISYAHGYAIRNKYIGTYPNGMSRWDRVKTPIGRGEIHSAETQVEQIIAKSTVPKETLFVLIVDTLANKTQLAHMTNKLILHPQVNARRILMITTGVSDPDTIVASKVINDPRVEISTYDSVLFLQKMQNEHYKYGLRDNNNPCVLNTRMRCSRPERFFWCREGSIGSRAHFFLADDIIKTHYTTKC